MFSSPICFASCLALTAALLLRAPSAALLGPSSALCLWDNGVSSPERLRVWPLPQPGVLGVGRSRCGERRRAEQPCWGQPGPSMAPCGPPLVVGQGAECWGRGMLPAGECLAACLGRMRGWVLAVLGVAEPPDPGFVPAGAGWVPGAAGTGQALPSTARGSQLVFLNPA